MTGLRGTLVLLGSIAVLACLQSLVSPREASAQGFIRGDANRDGKVSMSDGITIRRHLFAGAWFPPCRDAADANDDGVLMLDDEIEILRRVMGPPPSHWTLPLPAPYPAPGDDPTADDLDCSGPLAPAQASEDTVELGSVTASPGEKVSIPISLTSSVDVEAVQLIVRYDPGLLSVASKLDLDGTYYDRFASDEQFHPVNVVTMRPEEGIFTIGLMGSVAYDGYAIEAGEDVLVGKIIATVSAGASPGTVISLEPTNGDGGGGSGPNGIVNELTEKGEARYLSVLPRTVGAALRVEIAAFSRGDSNSDGRLDISDPIATLGDLFLEGNPASCPDAADSNDDGKVDISDPVMTLGFLFDPAPGTASGLGVCGADDTADGLDRCEYEACP